MMVQGLFFLYLSHEAVRCQYTAAAYLTYI